MYNNLLWAEKGNIGILKINSPKTLNALNSFILKELDEWVERVKDLDLKAIVLTGEGKAFVAGADIKEMSTMTPEEAKSFGEYGSKVFRKIEKLKIPIIAAVNGFALGGGMELALSCDIILSGENAKFGQPEVGLGIIPGFSGTQRLPRAIGIGMAKELIYTGSIIDSNKAKEISLVNEVYPQDELFDKAIELAEKIAKNSSSAVSFAKEAINTGMQIDIDSGINYENGLFAMCFSLEQKEGMAAFLEKRKPEFK